MAAPHPFGGRTCIQGAAALQKPVVDVCRSWCLSVSGRNCAFGVWIPRACALWIARTLRTDLFDGAQIIAVAASPPLQLPAWMPNPRKLRGTRPSVRRCRRRPGGRRRADRRAVDDQHRHRRCRRHRRQVRALAAPARSWCASRSTRTRPPPRWRRSARARGAGLRRAADRRFPLTTATSCCASIPPAPRRWPSTASTRATSAAAASATRSSPR
jgi:hypothetical protein